MSEHQERSEVMGQLVHRRCRVPVARVQASNKSWRKEQRGVVMNNWIAEISGEGVTPVLRANTLEVLRDLGERFIPADALPASGRAADGMLQTVLVVVNVL